MATLKDAEQALIDAITAKAPKVARPSSLLELAEALAWVRSPSQSHGGSTKVSS